MHTEHTQHEAYRHTMAIILEPMKLNDTFYTVDARYHFRVSTIFYLTYSLALFFMLDSKSFDMWNLVLFSYHAFQWQFQVLFSFFPILLSHAEHKKLDKHKRCYINFVIAPLKAMLMWHALIYTSTNFEFHFPQQIMCC